MNTDHYLKFDNEKRAAFMVNHSAADYKTTTFNSPLHSSTLLSEIIVNHVQNYTKVFVLRRRKKCADLMANYPVIRVNIYLKRHFRVNFFC